MSSFCELNDAYKTPAPSQNQVPQQQHMQMQPQQGDHYGHGHQEDSYTMAPKRCTHCGRQSFGLEQDDIIILGLAAIFIYLCFSKK